jgi:hypothetical protein
MDDPSLKRIEDTVLGAIEASLAAQLKAVRALRTPGKPRSGRPPGRTPTNGISQTNMALDILKEAGTPLHIDEILTRIQRRYGLTLIRDSLVSAITKKVFQGKEFQKTSRNTFKAL